MKKELLTRHFKISLSKHMDFKSQTLKELQDKAGSLEGKRIIVGLDGFVDKLVTPVAERFGPGGHFTPIPTITDFAKRIGDAAGRSANIEFYPKAEKLGGNGPIMADSLANLGLSVKYIGALGYPDVHPVFKDFASRTEAVSICEPGVTHAAEFNDGKIMFGSLTSVEEITYQRIIEIMSEGHFFDALSRAHLQAWVNWTMIPNMSAFFSALLGRVLPNLNSLEPRQFFFDLADPAKRSQGDIRSVLSLIRRFQSYGNVSLGLNYSEAIQVEKVLFNRETDSSGEEDLKKQASRIRNELDIGCVVVHPTEGAACATREELAYVPGPLCKNPRTTTGAGDHFNSGFMTGRLLGLKPRSCLTLAVATSGFYVRQARSPAFQDLDNFIRNWPANDS